MNMSDTRNDDFSALFEVTQTISSILEPKRLLAQVLEIAMKHLDAERGFLLLKDQEKEAGFTVAASRNFAGDDQSSALAASSSVVKQVLASGESVLTVDAATDERFEASTSIVAQKILSIVCVPLKSQELVRGALYLDSAKTRGKFNNDSLQFLTVFGNLATIALDNAQSHERLRVENDRLRVEADSVRLFEGIVGHSKEWRAVLDLVRRVIDVDVSVLITGETGTGKELIARNIHAHSARATKPFVAVNCSAIPEQLLESELFGYRKGAFTNAVSDRIGLIEYAHSGTLFLDEIGTLAPQLQSKLLRVLQEREVRRVGDVENRKVDVRILAATNRDLQEEVRKGLFREDLFFRLNVIEIHLPPLRQRTEDIPLLGNYFLKNAATSYKRNVKAISSKAMQLLLTHPWHGNVRELQNVVERAVVLCGGEEVQEQDLHLQRVHESDLLESGLTLEEFERRLVERTLKEMKGNRTQTAETLGVSLRWLQYRLKEWEIGKE
jgi:Nif-specific regulatory protein